ncbi:MAG: hypothetical protein KME45_03305 [Stenomitos rutilans HA7619-LM2]|nr:hypothetical protein [Stenomitos rutilans HA7619-LM2]MBW4469412.1 hypothetical protein [Stenomitos rutilans HA7619-LM2]
MTKRSPGVYLRAWLTFPLALVIGQTWKFWKWWHYRVSQKILDGLGQALDQIIAFVFQDENVDAEEDDSEAWFIAIAIATHKLKLPSIHPDVVAETKRLMAEYQQGMTVQKTSRTDKTVANDRP